MTPILSNAARRRQDAFLAQAIARVVDGHFAAQRTSAVKRGRNPAWPFVPVVIRADGTTHHINARLAFATRDEAIGAAQAWLDTAADTFARHLADPAHRALRRQHGLPEEI